VHGPMSIGAASSTVFTSMNARGWGKAASRIGAGAARARRGKKARKSAKARAISALGAIPTRAGERKNPLPRAREEGFEANRSDFSPRRCECRQRSVELHTSTDDEQVFLIHWEILLPSIVVVDGLVAGESLDTSPHVFTGPDGPGVTTEWRVRECSNGKCIVRVRHWTVADSSEWDGLLEGAENGWPAFFENLKSYLA